jgi:hypothetical protein
MYNSSYEQNIYAPECLSIIAFLVLEHEASDEHKWTIG